MTGKIPQVGGEPPSELDRFWVDVAQGIVKESVGVLEDAAKQLISATSILQGIYFAAVSFSDLKKTLLVHDNGGWILGFLFVIPIIPWLFSIGLATRVFKPELYITNLQSPDLSRRMYEDIIAYKQRYLKYAYWALLIGLILLGINIIVYLEFMPMVSTSSS